MIWRLTRSENVCLFRLFEITGVPGTECKATLFETSPMGVRVAVSGTRVVSYNARMGRFPLNIRFLRLLAVGLVTAFLAYNIYQFYTVNLQRTDPGGVFAASNVVLSTVPLTGRQQERLSDAERELDPSASGWRTESFSDSANSALKLLARGIENGGSLAIDSLIAEDFRCTQLRPAALTDAFDDDNVVVRRSEDIKGLVGARVRKLSSLADAVADLPASGSAEDCHVKFKIVGVNLDDGAADLATTAVYAEGFGINENCLLYTSPSPRDATLSRMPSSA